MRATLLLALLALLVTPARGDQSSLTLEVQADGRGQLRLEVTEDLATSARLLEGATTTQALERRAQELALQRLGRWEGVACWTGIVAGVTGERRVRLRATGWFEDLRQVREAAAGDDAPGLAFDLVVDDATLVVSVREGAARDLPDLRDLAGLLARGAEGVSLLREVTKELLAMNALAGRRHEVALVLPADVAEAPGATTVDGRRAAWVVDGEALAAAVDAVYARAEALAGQVEAGDLTLDEATAQLVPEAAERRIVARAALPPEAARAEAADAFGRSFDAAQGAWASSIWRGRLERWRAWPPRPRTRRRAGAGRRARAGRRAPPAGDVAPVVTLAVTARPARRPRRLRNGAWTLEPNDDPASAATLEPGAYRGLTLRGEDWYRVDVPAGHEVKVEMTFDVRAADLDLALLAADGAVLATSEGLGGRERLRVLPLTPGPHLLRVHAPPGWAGPRAPAYQLDVEVVPWTAADRFEPNAPPHPPARLAPGSYDDLVCTGEDRYAVVAPIGSRVDVHVTWADDQGDLDLTLVDGEGRLLARAGQGGRAACHAPPAGDVVVRVTGDEGTRYRLTVALAAGPAADRFEPNDAPGAARDLPPGEHGDLRLLGDDWYRVEVPAGHVLRVRATSSAGEGDLDLAIHRPDGALLRAAAGPGNDERLEVAPPAAGPLLLRVHDARGAAAPLPYTLSVTTVPLRPADRHEPNDSPEQARDLAPGEHDDLRCTVEDWYRVALRAGQRLTVVVLLDPAQGDLDLELFAPDGRARAASTGVGAREEATLLAERDGPHLVRVYRGEAPYRLVVTVE
ncbi:MAG: PPC domain-containing protein [Planctomycetes bacterium]|nr:PPC domain-containing protein [Planctomycetota bacterium]